MDDQNLIATLLYRGEGDTLDFKLQQYEFENADDDKKSILLKDILAFANAWRDGPAYILIGVRDGTREIIGLDKDIDDSRLQQFINGKLNRPLIFSYRSVEFDGRILGLYTIPLLERPIYATKNVGRVKADTVYVRRGSSTAEAKPEEIARMGAAAAGPSHAPRLRIRLVKLDADATPLESLDREIMDVECPDEESIPNYPEPVRSPFGTAILSPLFDKNENYYRQLATFIRESAGTVGFKLEVQNIGDAYASDVTVKLTVPSAPGFRICDAEGLPNKPDKKRNFILPRIHSRNKSPFDTITFESGRGAETATFFLGKIQAGETCFSSKLFLVHPPENLSEIRITAHADQLKAPMEIVAPTSIHVVRQRLTVEQIKGYAKKLCEEEDDDE
ncbi:AlbA family DNA-binding domain-containing protein [Burkholderia sp. 22313]|uniref:AlbA family DNA-binding domain-containing protein n=1 Tax=Burkholderia sp. 22313 TaxID=3453908 RepID=UPI003F8415FF